MKKRVTINSLREDLRRHQEEVYAILLGETEKWSLETVAIVVIVSVLTIITFVKLWMDAFG